MIYNAAKQANPQQRDPATMAYPRSQEVVNISWPMTIPPHARFSITSRYPLNLRFPHNTSFELRLDRPLHLCSSSPIHITPSGTLSPGFARGWCRLPAELKLAVLRHNLIYASPISSSNVNRAIRDTLHPYLRMTPEIGDLSRGVFFGENTFVILTLPEEPSSNRSLPPVGVRPLIRKVCLVTWLQPRSSEVITALAERRLGFDNLAWIEIRCSVVDFVRSTFSDPDVAMDSDEDTWTARVDRRLPSEVSFASRGLLDFDRPQLGRGGAHGKLLQIVDLVEGLVKERFKFGNITVGLT